MLKIIEETAKYLRSRLQYDYKVGIILGSGLGSVVDEMQVDTVMKYASIPNFPVSTVSGHEGNLIAGTLGGKKVLVMQGRLHYYEGYSMQKVTFPVRVMKALGVEVLIVSNASGGVNRSYKAGDIMLISDHINLFPEHPLRGKNDDALGERFPSMVDAYSPRLRKLAKEVAAVKKIELQEGVYAGLQGPSFETPAEYGWLRVIGADAVGMSTVPEVIVARHAGLECLGISVITNATGNPDAIKTSHEEVKSVGNSVQPRMVALVSGILEQL